MKNYYLTLVTLFCVTYCISQETMDEKKEKFKRELDTALSKYNFDGKDTIPNFVIQNKLLKEHTEAAFNYVIFSGSDLVGNSSAFGYTQNEEKTSISANTNFRLGDTLTPYYFKAGANATGSNNIFNFYSKDSWSNNVSLNVGIIARIRSRTFFSSGRGEKKEKLKISHIKREIYAKDWLNDLEKLSKIKDEMDKLKTSLANNDIPIFNETIYPALATALPEVKKLMEQKKYFETYVLLEKEEKKIKVFDSVFEVKDGTSETDKKMDLATKALNKEKKVTKKLKTYIKDEILYKYDKQNDPTYGYHFMWLDANVSLGNSTYKFNENNIDAAILQEVTDSIGAKNSLNKLKTIMSANVNLTSDRWRSIWFLQGGISTTFASFLENPTIYGIPKIIKDVNENYVLQDEDDRYLGNYADIKETLHTGAFNFYAAYLFTKKKVFGVNAAISHIYLIDKPDGIFYKNNFTALFGPIFRKVKDDNTSLTFGIDLGWQNAMYNTRVSDDFTARIRVGIPFNIFIRKKAEKKS